MAVNSKIRRAFHSAVLPWLVLAIGIPASFSLSTLIQDSVEKVARLRFEREARDASGIFEGSLRSYGDVLYALRALFASDEPIDRLRFHRFVESLDLKHRYPGFISLNYAAYVSARDKNRFEKSVRNDASLNPRGYPQFAIKPPGERSEYFVMVYLEPVVDYKFAFGLDLGANPMAANPEKVAAALRAGRDSGQILSSAQPLQVDRAEKSVYLAMRLAVYKKGMPIDTVEQRRLAYVGSVGAGFDVGSLMREGLNEDKLGYMRIRLYDAGTAEHQDSDSSEAERLLFDSEELVKGSPPQSSLDASQTFVHVLPVEIAGRVWELKYSAPKDAVIDRLNRFVPSMVLAGGLLSTLLLFGVFYSLSLSRISSTALLTSTTSPASNSRR